MLFAEFEKVDDELKGLVNSGKYPRVSAEIYPSDSVDNPKPGKPYLKALSFLGAWTPEVKGLGAVAFGENGQAVAVFGEDVEIGDPFDAAQSDPKLDDNTQREEENNVEELEKLKAELAERDKTIGELQTANAAKDSEIQTFGEKQAAINAELDKLREEKARAAHDARVAGYKSFAEGLANAGQLPPKLSERVVYLMDVIEQMGVKDYAFKLDGTIVKTGDYYVFGEGDETQTPIEAFKSVLSELPKVIEFGEKARPARRRLTMPMPSMPQRKPWSNRRASATKRRSNECREGNNG
jgi:hypothetical protein